VSSPVSASTCLPCSDKPVASCLQPPIMSIISSSNLSSPSVRVPPMTTSTNLHPMVTRRKVGIF
jgi:hypothetical protein